MTPLTPNDVQAALGIVAPDIVVQHFDSSTFSSADAAAAIGCRLGQIAKSMCLVVADAPVLVVASGDQRVSDAKVARHFGVGRKKVKMARPEQCIDVFGYPPGGVSPVGLRTPSVKILIDETLMRWPLVYAAAGTDHDNFAIDPRRLPVVTGGIVVDCVRESAPAT